MSCTPISKSLNWCKGTPVLPGLTEQVYCINKANITAWPTLVKDSNGRVTSANLSGSFTLASNAHWDVIDVLADKSQFTHESQGEVPSQTTLNKLTLVHPTVGDDAGTFTGVVSNSDMVYIIKTADGKYRVVGSEMWPTKTTVNGDSGQGAAGTASTTINVEASDLIPAPFYAGPIVTADGTINPSNITISLSCDSTEGTVKIGTDTASSSVSKTLATGTSTTITATALTGKTFDHWSDGDTSASRTIEATCNLTLTASFTASAS